MNSIIYAVCIASIISSALFMLLPHRRMLRICSLVIGLFIILSIAVPVRAVVMSFKGERWSIDEYAPQDTADDAYIEAIAKATTDNLVTAMDHLLQNEGIKADNIVIGIRIDEEQRIYVSRVVIYISREYEHDSERIAQIVYRNLSKEPKIVVQEETVPNPIEP